MENFRNWYIRNQDAISWFLVGLLTGQGFDQLGRGQYGSALVSFGFAYLNYFFSRTRIS
jgi:hypothetical protein